MAFSTILVPVDFSDVTDRVVSVARSLSDAFRGKVVLLHVAEPEPDFVGFDAGPSTVRAAVATDLHREHKHIEELKGMFTGSGSEILALQVQGPTIQKILSESQRVGADLIVMGSHGHGALHHLLAGSVTTGVLASTICPVVVVPSKTRI